jgi:hypothetical protein
MTAPVYLLDKIARHGAASERLRAELRCPDAWGESRDPVHGIGFDAANFVWAFLALSGHDAAQESREIRNAVAESIIAVLTKHGIQPERLSLEESML